MKRREFSAALLARRRAGRSACRRARPGRRPVEGTHYVRLSQPLPVAAGRQDRGGRVLLVRLPALQRLRADARRLGQEAAGRRGLPPRAGRLPRRAVRRAPAHLLRARELGQVEAMHRKVFDAIHGDRQRLDKPADIAAFVAKNGVDGAKFIEVYNSFCGADQGAPGAAAGARPTRSTACRRSASRAASSPRARWPARRERALRGRRLPDPAVAQGQPDVSRRTASAGESRSPRDARSRQAPSHEPVG